MAKKRLKNKKIPKPNIKRGTEPKHSEAPLTFDFSKKNWLKCISIKDYTNKLKDETMFATYIFEIFNKLIPTLQENWDEIRKHGGKRGRWPHCHPVNEENLDLVNSIISMIHGSEVNFTQTYGPSLWQLGVSQNIRLIAIYDYTINSLTPVFVDYHHLIQPSIKYNQKDYEQYTFCPYCEYSRMM